MIVDERALLAECIEDDVFPFKIVGMHAFEDGFKCAGKLSGLEGMNPMELVGLSHDIGTDVPLKASGDNEVK